MTPAQMLRRVAPEVPPTLTKPHTAVLSHSPADHVTRVVAPPSPAGIQIKVSEAEPWILEQFMLRACPTCGEHLLHMMAPNIDPDKHFYICEEEPAQHRWTLIQGA